MTRQLKKLLHFALTGTFTVILAACYGAPVELQDYKLVKATDQENNPIEGLQVELNADNQLLESQYTDANGVVEFNNVSQSNVTIRITDVDGTQNGGEFESKEIEADSVNEFDVRLTKKQ